MRCYGRAMVDHAQWRARKDAVAAAYLKSCETAFTWTECRQKLPESAREIVDLCAMLRGDTSTYAEDERKRHEPLSATVTDALKLELEHRNALDAWRLAVEKLTEK